MQRFLYPEQKELPDDFAMPIWDHLDELRERVLLAALAAAFAVAGCFAFSKDLVVFLEAPVADQGVRFLQLSPGEFFFTTLKVAGYAGLLLATPTVLYEVVAYVVPGLTRSERKLLAPIVFGSGLLFYAGLVFSYEVLAPAALTFFVSYADGAVESLWSIDQYFEFVLVLMLSTGESVFSFSFFNFFQLFFLKSSLFFFPLRASREKLRRLTKNPFLSFFLPNPKPPSPIHETRNPETGLAFQVPVIQLLLGQAGLVTSRAMLSQWRWVVVGATVAAAVLTPSTDPFTQTLLAVPLVGLYMGGALGVKAIEAGREKEGAALS